MSAPLARFVAQNYRDLTFPYKRYTYGDVFRREKPDSARYRSFMQFDADIIGNVNEAQADAEICNIIADTFLNCGLKVDQFTINVSNRKIVQGLISELKITSEQELKVIRAIDKLERIGMDGVNDLLQKERKDESGAITKGANLTNDQTSQIIEFLKIQDIKSLKSNIKSKISQEGINEIEDLFNILSRGNFSKLVKTNFNIVRGLAYYSGFCVETNLNFKGKNVQGKEIDIGSCASGGRYNSLIKRFKGVDFKGTGMSIGVDRLVFALNQLDQFKEDDNNNILVCVLDPNYMDQYYKIVNELRENNINSEIYLDSTKNLKKQLTYADKKGCSLAIICGQEEIEQGRITIKKLKSKKENDQISISSKNLINEIKKLI
jgi:histidyl-tRNA synthetase